MAANDYKVISGSGPIREFVAEDRTTSSVTSTMLVGEPVKLHSEGAQYVIPLATGDPECGSDEFIGVVAKNSTETATVDGVVLVWTCLPVKTILEAKATTTSNINTAAKLKAIVGDWVAGDVTAVSGTNGTFTIDEDEGSDEDVHGFRVLEGDIVRYTLRFSVHANASMAGPQA